MAWRSDSWQPPLTVKIHYEESYLLTNLLFDCYQAKKKELAECTDSIDKRHLENEIEMIVGLRHKLAY